MMMLRLEVVAEEEHRKTPAAARNLLASENFSDKATLQSLIEVLFAYLCDANLHVKCELCRHHIAYSFMAGGGGRRASTHQEAAAAQGQNRAQT